MPSPAGPAIHGNIGKTGNIQFGVWLRLRHGTARPVAGNVSPRGGGCM